MMNENETYSDFIEAAKEAFAKLNEELEKVQEALCELAEDISDSFKKAFEELKSIDFERDPLPRPQKYICMKKFVLDRRKTINRIKKKKGTVYRIHYEHMRANKNRQKRRNQKIKKQKEGYLL